MWSFLKQPLIFKWLLLSHQQSNRDTGKESPGFQNPGSRALLARPCCLSYRSTIHNNTELENVILRQTKALFCPLWSLFLFSVCLVSLLSFFFQCCIEFHFQQLVNGASGEGVQELKLSPWLKASFQLASHTSWQLGQHRNGCRASTKV